MYFMILKTLGDSLTEAIDNYNAYIMIRRLL